MRLEKLCKGQPDLSKVKIVCVTWKGVREKMGLDEKIDKTELNNLVLILKNLKTLNAAF